MHKADIIFKENIRRIVLDGSTDMDPRPRYKSDGEPALSKYISQVYEEYNIGAGELPLTTLRPIAIKSGINEIRAFYQEQTNDLFVMEDKFGLAWWKEWEDGSTGTIGQRYGATVRRHDLIGRLLKGLKEDPYSRRHIMNLWQEEDFKETGGLLPCAFLTMWTVRNVNNEQFLDVTLIQRSSDYLVAGHINMMQYVALQMMVAHEVGMQVGKFARFTQNLHIYQRQVFDALDLLGRPTAEASPKLVLNAEGKSFYDIADTDFTLTDYHPCKPQLTFDLAL